MPSPVAERQERKSRLMGTNSGLLGLSSLRNVTMPQGLPFNSMAGTPMAATPMASSLNPLSNVRSKADESMMSRSRLPSAHMEANASMLNMSTTKHNQQPALETEEPLCNQYAQIINSNDVDEFQRTTMYLEVLKRAIAARSNQLARVLKSDQCTVKGDTAKNLRIENIVLKAEQNIWMLIGSVYAEAWRGQRYAEPIAGCIPTSFFTFFFLCLTSSLLPDSMRSNLV